MSTLFPNESTTCINSPSPSRFAVTITRKTTYIDICEIDDSYKILSMSDLEKERNLVKEKFEFEST